MSLLWRLKAWQGSQLIFYKSPFPVFFLYSDFYMNEGKWVFKKLKLKKMKQSLKQNLADAI